MKNSQRAQSLVELAILAPLLLLLALGTVAVVTVVQSSDWLAQATALASLDAARSNNTVCSGAQTVAQTSLSGAPAAPPLAGAPAINVTSFTCLDQSGNATTGFPRGGTVKVCTNASVKLAMVPGWSNQSVAKCSTSLIEAFRSRG